ncbi:MAG: efflux RND transporter permease subunit [Desulfobacterales bacterium]|nr:efflux RND transporter permease subunit [Desulfobacterales bacterium]
MGSRRVTTFIEDGEEYDVLVEGEEKMYRSPSDLANIQVRSERTGRLIPLSNLVRIEEFADSASLNRYNRIRSITIEANLTEGYSLGEALTYLSDLVRTELPPGVSIGYKGESLEYITSGRSIYFIFLLALVVVYLAMAAQFESYIHPFVIMLTVPLAIAGALFGLFLTGQSLNIYSQIGMIMLVGLATKNGILIVEFANQLRDAGASFEEAAPGGLAQTAAADSDDCHAHRRRGDSAGSCRRGRIRSPARDRDCYPVRNHRCNGIHPLHNSVRVPHAGTRHVVSAGHDA